MDSQQGLNLLKGILFEIEFSPGVARTEYFLAYVLLMLRLKKQEWF